MDDSDRQIIRVRICGAVQRVGFRYWLARQAQAVGLEGWVRNRADGTVEALLAGEKDAVLSMLRACETGPPRARVAEIDASPGSEKDLSLRDPSALFDILPTD